MFVDGIKINVSCQDGLTWRKSPLLQFRTIVDEETGQILSNTRVALYNGLQFYIKQSNQYPNTYHYSMRGSLAKFWNNGEHNAEDYDLNTVETAIKTLQNRFNITPETSTIHNLEFGVNINLAITAKKFLRGLVASKNSEFCTLKIEGNSIGKKLQKQRYILKLYDKGKQAQIQTDNLVRIEIAVKKMHYLKDYNIKTLADLTQHNKIGSLSTLLLNEWGNVIYYDKGMKWRKMSSSNRMKMLYYRIPVNWVQFSMKQRYRAKKHFNELIHTYGTSTIYDDFTQLIIEKWTKLTASNCPCLNQHIEKPQPSLVSTFEPLECRVQKRTPNYKKFELENFKTKKCKCCKKDISYKKTLAIYCSKKCNNTINGKKRTKRRREKRKIAKNHLQNKKSINQINTTNYDTKSKVSIT